MTDNEIVKALEGMIQFADTVGGSVLNMVDVKTLKNILDLINRQKAEIERLNKQNLSVIEHLKKARKQLKTAKAEAIKEFAERLKETDGNNNHTFDDCASILVSEEYQKGRREKACEMWKTIDNLVKETVGDNDG